MEIVKTKFAGLCSGVKSAYEKALAVSGEGVYLLGELCHNAAVNAKITACGAKIVDSIEAIPDNSTMLIRSHGVVPEIYSRAAEKGLKVIDCTCPFVRRIHEIAEKCAAQGKTIIIYGKENHPEVIGVLGRCGGKGIVCRDVSLLSPEVLAEKLCVVAQTTADSGGYEKFLVNLAKNAEKTVEIFKTICYTTIERQKECIDIARECDAVLVVGGANSSNTHELFMLSKSVNPETYSVSEPAAFDYRKVKNYCKVGLLCGASTPNELIMEVFFKMENNTTEVKQAEVTEEVVKAEENVAAPVAEAVETVEAVAETAPEAAPVAETETVEETAQAEEAAAPAEEKAEEPKKELNDMERAFAKMGEKPVRFRKGQVITATISAATDEGLALYIKGTKKEIVLPSEQLIKQPYNKADYDGKIGDEIRVMITDLDPVKLSEKEIAKILEEEALIDDIEKGKEFEAICDGTNKGGLTCTFGTYQVFVPSSQIRIGFVKELDKYVGKKLRLKAEKVERKERRKQIVASQRVLLESEKAEKEGKRKEKEDAFFAVIAVGDIIRGTVVRFAQFGAFVDVNGFDCLAHISDLSWTNIKTPADVLELNKEYEFKILAIDEEKKKVSLGYKQLQRRPWELAVEKYQKGDVIKGKVVRITSFGAFVEVEKGIDGLVHVSQISHEWLENPTSILQVGQEVDVKVLNVDADQERMTLSIKALQPAPENADRPQRPNKRKDDDDNGGDRGDRQPRAPRHGGNRGDRQPRDDGEVREWNESGEGGASIAELLGNGKE